MFLGPEPQRGEDPLVSVLFLSFFLLSLLIRHFNPKFDPLNMLKNSPNLARTSGLVKYLIKCKNYPPKCQNVLYSATYVSNMAATACRREIEPKLNYSSHQDLQIIY